MTGIGILRTTGWLYAALGVLCAVALLADIVAGVGTTGRFALGVVLLVFPFASFSYLLLNRANRDRSRTDFTVTLCLLAALYFLVNRIYGFFYWYTTGTPSLLVTWASLPLVWLEATVCVALGIALLTRREIIWWLAFGLGAVQLYQALTTLPGIINSYPSVRYFWPDIAPQIFKIGWLVLFAVLVVVQLLERRQGAPAG